MVLPAQRNGDKWVATIHFQKKRYFLGIFSSVKKAIEARKEAEENLYAPFIEWYYKTYLERQKNINAEAFDVVSDNKQ